MKSGWLSVLGFVALLALFSTLGIAGDIQTDGALVSTLSGDPPLEVNSSSKVQNLNSDFLDNLDSTHFAAAAHTHQVSRFKTFGPVDFWQTPPGGNLLSCVFPGTNCRAPVGSTTTIAVSTNVEGPATIEEVTCQVRDDDSVGDITLRLYDGAFAVASVSTSGASSSTQDLTLLPDHAVTLSTRGPTFELEFASGSDEPQMFLFACLVQLVRTVG